MSNNVLDNLFYNLLDRVSGIQELNQGDAFLKAAKDYYGLINVAYLGVNQRNRQCKSEMPLYGLLNVEKKTEGSGSHRHAVFRQKDRYSIVPSTVPGKCERAASPVVQSPHNCSPITTSSTRCSRRRTVPFSEKLQNASGDGGKGMCGTPAILFQC